MLVLYHLMLSPFSRKVRIVLGEKDVSYDLVAEKVWQRRPEFLRLNPAAQVPVLVTEEGTAIADSGAIAEYLDESYPDPPLIGADAVTRAEVRRLVAWFDIKFYREVTRNLTGEKVQKRFLGLGEPSSEAIRAGLANLPVHLEYIAWLTERRNWLAGERFSLADIAAAAHISTLDYVGDVPWEDFQPAKDWYARIKSRPSFRPILADHIPGLQPPRHYADLDF
ncbi:MAG TPA: glutathione S-transferase family protein [Alphaproteobacteria bacterium]|nr:glutathione S-transferase family protein [Alphaproteobacteria bacterium]